MLRGDALFRGILLGTGGLTRAYSRGAADALAASGISRVCLWECAALTIPYGLYEQVKLLAAECGGVIEDTQYGAEIVLRLPGFPAGGREAMQRRLTELSAGRCALEAQGEQFMPGPREEVR